MLTRAVDRTTRGNDGRQTVEVEIVAREDVSDTTFLLEVYYPMMARPGRPGRSVIMTSHEHVEQITLTIAGHGREKGSGTAEDSAPIWQIRRGTPGYAK